MAKTFLVINPNSSSIVTAGMYFSFTGTGQFTPSETESSHGFPQLVSNTNAFDLVFYTAPSSAPESINDYTTASLTATSCFEDLKTRGWLDAGLWTGYLVCCFSDHPLTRMLQEHLPASLPCIGIFEAGITQALLLGPSSRFAILSTGEGFKMRLHEGVSRLLGASGSTRFAGVITTGLGVVELRTGEPGHVQSKMKAGARRCVEELGADTIILGCAGMAGMEPYIHEAAGSRSIRVLDGVKAGVELLKMLHNLSG